MERGGKEDLYKFLGQWKHWVAFRILRKEFLLSWYPKVDELLRSPTSKGLHLTQKSDNRLKWNFLGPTGSQKKQLGQLAELRVPTRQAGGSLATVPISRSSQQKTKKNISFPQHQTSVFIPFLPGL